MHGYPPFQGRAELREAIAAHYRADHGVELDPEREVAVVPGTKTAIMLAVLACAGRGPGGRPARPRLPGLPVGHRAGAARAGWRWRSTPPPAGSPTSTRWAGERPALVVLNYPSNPCAACEAPGTFEAAVAWAHEHGSWLLNDLAYGFLAFDGRRARSVLEVDGAREVAVELWSPSKVYGMAGWRVGFAVGNAEVVGRIRVLLDHLARRRPGRAPARPGGGAERRSGARRRAPRGLSPPPRRARARASGSSRPRAPSTPGGACPTGSRPSACSSAARVAVAPGEGFGARGAGYARLSLAVDDDDLAEGVARLAAAQRDVAA